VNWVTVRDRLGRLILTADAYKVHPSSRGTHMLFNRLRAPKILLFGPLPEMKPEELRRHIYSTYWYLRLGLFGLALAFPILLFVIGWFNHIDLQGSMSEYYFAFAPHESQDRIFPVRVVFVGILFALGFSLMLYKGLSERENNALNLAGAAAIAAALFPMQPPDYCTNCGHPWVYLHQIAGVVVFSCLAYVAWCCTNVTESQLDPSLRNWFRRTYRLLAAAMFLVPLAIIVWTAASGIYDKRLYFFETTLLLMFALYWGVRSVELWLTQAERNALGIGQNLEEQPSTPWGIVTLFFRQVFQHA